MATFICLAPILAVILTSLSTSLESNNKPVPVPASPSHNFTSLANSLNYLDTIHTSLASTLAVIIIYNVPVCPSAMVYSI